MFTTRHLHKAAATKEDARLVDRLSERIKPLLAGHPAAVQGAVCGDLFAIFVAGHQGPGVEALREELIEAHLKLVRELVAYYDDERLRHASAAGGVM